MNSAAVEINGALGGRIVENVSALQRKIELAEDTPQAPVVTSTAIIPKFYATRLANSSLPEDRKIGIVRKTEDLYVIPGEVVYMSRDSARLLFMRSYPGDFRARAFTSFNGFAVPEGWSQEEYEALNKPIGFAVTDYMVSNKEQSKEGFTTRVGGGGTTLNNGTKTFLPGDLIYARRPSINPAQRKIDNENRPIIKGIPVGKETAILEPKTVSDLYHAWARRSVQWFMDDSEQTLLEVSRQRGKRSGAVRRLALKEELALQVKDFVVWSVLSGVSILEAYGIISFNDVTVDEGSGSWRVDRGRYDNFPAKILRQYNSYSMSQQTMSVEPSSSGQGYEYSLTKYTNEDLAALKARRTNQLGYIAALLSAVKPETVDDHIKPSHELLQTIVGRALYPFLPNASLQKGLSIGHYLADVNAKRPRSRMNQSLGLERIHNDLLRLQSEAAVELHKAFNTIFEAETADVIAVATNISSPGNALDYVM